MKRIIKFIQIFLVGLFLYWENAIMASDWLPTWATAPQLVESYNNPPSPYFANNSLRQIVQVSVGGSQIRLRLTNEYGKQQIEIKSVDIAIAKSAGSSSEIEDETLRVLTFNGNTGITMSAGQIVTSDPIDFNFGDRENIAITIHFGDAPSADFTGHPGSRTTSYIATGDTNDFTTAATTEHWYFINALETVKEDKNAKAVAILGNSITDGLGSTTNEQNRWTDVLSNRLLSNELTKNISVLNMGIGGNCVISGGKGPSASSRYMRDLFSYENVGFIILFEGVNDLGYSGNGEKTANTIISIYKQIIREAHKRGIFVYAATIMPFKNNGYYTADHEKGRQVLNEWIRNGGEVDGVIDFDKVMRSESDVEALNPDYLFENDWLHPNAEGHRAMGESVDVDLFIRTDVPENPESPYTNMLVNAGFEYSAEGVLNNGATTRGDVYGWTRKGTIIGNSYGLSKDALMYEGSSICWYNSTPMPDEFELSQTIEGIPAGEYIVRCKLAVFTDRVTNERLFANNVVQYYGPRSAYDKNIVEGESYSFAGYSFASTNGSAAPLQEMAVKVTVSEGEPLTVGIRSSNLKADGTRATDNSGWFKVDDFRIELVREINSDSLLSDLDSLINQATDLRDNTVVGVHSGEYPQESRTAFEQAIEEAELVLNKGTEQPDEDINKAIQDLTLAIANYVESVVDYNSYIVNRSFEYKADGVKNDGSTVRGIPYGWSSVGTLVPDAWGNQSYGINNQALNMVGQNCCWINSGVMPQPFELYQVVKGLPMGYYELTCRMACFTNLITTQRLFANNNVTYFGSADDYDKNLTEGEICSFADLQTTDNNESSKANLQEMKVRFFIKPGEDLRLGIRSGNVLKDGSTATDNSGWFKVDEFTLDYLGFDGLELDENASSPSIETDQTCDVFLNRTFSGNDEWNTFCVPFDIDAEQAALYFKDIRKLQSVEYQEGLCVLGFSDEQTTVEAGVPYIVKTNEAYESLLFSNVSVKTTLAEEKAVVAQTDETEVKMIGNYGLIDKLENKYFIKDNHFYLADAESDVEVKGYRATIEMNESQASDISTLYIKVDGEVTAVDNVLMNEILKGKLYDVKGNLLDTEYKDKDLESLPKGIYIINGKKIVNK